MIALAVLKDYILLPIVVHVLHYFNKGGWNSIPSLLYFHVWHIVNKILLTMSINGNEKTIEILRICKTAHVMRDLKNCSFLDFF